MVLSSPGIVGRSIAAVAPPREQNVFDNNKIVLSDVAPQPVLFITLHNILIYMNILELQ